MGYMTFSEFLEQRDEGARSAPGSPPEIDGGAATPGEPTPGRDAAFPGAGDMQVTRQGHMSEGSLFRGVFKAVNPSRPASPTNSRLLASPFRKKLKSQVIGR